jgi:predicted Fe-S protein YdhL (DUF1289 family)
MNIPSPCIQICQLNDSDVCVGCGRTRDEIARWLAMSNDERFRIISALTTRVRAAHSTKDAPLFEE